MPGPTFLASSSSFKMSLMLGCFDTGAGTGLGEGSGWLGFLAFTFGLVGLGDAVTGSAFRLSLGEVFSDSANSCFTTEEDLWGPGWRFVDLASGWDFVDRASGWDFVGLASGSDFVDLASGWDFLDLASGWDFLDLASGWDSVALASGWVFAGLALAFTAVVFRSCFGSA